MFRDSFDKIDELRKEQRISRSELARRAGINPNTMSTLFSRRPKVLSDKYLLPIAAALNVSPSVIRNANIRAFPGTKLQAIDGACEPQAGNTPTNTAGNSKITLQQMQSIFEQLQGLDEEQLRFIEKYILFIRNS